MDNVEYQRIINSIDNSYLPSQVKATLKWIENFEVNSGKEEADELRHLAITKLKTFE